jgi:hypothetical protein
MFKKIILTALIASLAAVSSAQAQETRDFSMLATQTVQLPGTTYSIVFNSPELQVGEPRDMAKLSVAISSWLSANFGLSKMHHSPRAVISDTAKTTLYEGRTQTIYLPVGWNGASPIELSAFIRAMVHHLQNEAGVDDRHASEQLANVVQSRWLAMFGTIAQSAAAEPLGRVN